MKLEALKPVTVLGADGKAREVAVGATFDIADTGEAKRMVRGGVAKEVATLAAAPAAPAATTAQPEADARPGRR